MEILLIIGGVVILGLLVLAKKYLEEGVDKKNKPEKYTYKRAKFFMSRAEHEFYDVLQEAAGDEYQIFAQVHLSTILDYKVKGQSWQGALSHIQRKSVDFVLCDKDYLSPQLVIELDGKSHERSDRRDRDAEVERILDEAGLPLLRIENHGSFNIANLSKHIQSAVSEESSSTKET